MELIAEIGINHNGDLSVAKKLIDIAHSAGCQYVKFQKRTVEDVYTPEELAIPRESPFGTTTKEQKYGIEFTANDYYEIDAYCSRKGIKWFASPWDYNSITDIIEYGSCFYKIPSALLTSDDCIRECIKMSELPFILSTGMSTMDEIHHAVNLIPEGRLYSILHCTSTYPSKEDEQNLNVITTLKRHFPDTKIGFSNHSPGLTYMVGAMALGAEMIEFHITLDRTMYGSDQASSIEPEGVFKLGKYAKGMNVALGDGVKKIYDREIPILEKLRRI